MTNAMIVAPQPEAVDAGSEALYDGGNSVDAVITCALVQGVVDPLMCGIAGFGSLHLYLPRRAVHTVIDFHAPAPRAVRPDMWAHLIEGESRDGFGFLLRGLVNDIGYQSIAVPGSLKAYFEAHSAYGTLPWERVVAPAIEYAERGWKVRPAVRRFWTDPDRLGHAQVIDRLRFSETGRKLYFNAAGALIDLGDRFVNPDLGRTLRRIAKDGADVFYSGEIARAIDADMRAHGGILVYDDLAHYRTVRTEPLWTNYRGLDVATNQPPGGGLQLALLLNIIENFEPSALGHNTPDYIVVVAEAMKQATIDKDRFIGDPAFIDVPVARLASKAYAAAVAARIKTGERVHVPRAESAETKNTTHLAAVDKDGNIAAMTHSLGLPSGVITDGLGFMYNGCMNVFDPRPGRAGSLAPGKCRFSSIAPSIVFKGGRPMVVIGAPGGTHISMAILQALVNTLDFGMTIQEAVSAPRISATSDVIEIANRIPRRVERALVERGYRVERSHMSYDFASVHALRIDDGRITGGADPKGDGMALPVTH